MNKSFIGRQIFTVVFLLMSQFIFSQSIENAQTEFNVGMKYYNYGNYDKAIKSFSKTIEIYEKTSDAAFAATGYQKADYVAPTYSWIGECYRIQERYEDAIPLYEKAEEISTAAGQVLYASVYLGTKGTCLLALDRYAEAEKAIISALRTAKEQQYPYYQAMWNGHLGELYVNWENYELAEHHCREGIKLAKQTGDSYLEYLCITNLAQALNMQDKDQEAEKYYQESWEWAENNGYAEGLANIAENYGSMLVNQARYEEALSVYEKGLSYNEDTDDQKETASFNNMIGYVYFAKDEFETALSCFKKALDIAEKHGLREEVSSALNNIGTVFHSRGDLISALEYYRQAMEIDNELDNERSIIIDQTNIATIYHTWGLYKEAEELLKISLEKSLESNYIYEIPGLMNKNALLYIDWGDYENAEEYLNKGLKFAEENNVMESISDLYSSLGILNSKTGHFDKASEYFRKAIDIDRAAGKKINTAVLMLNFAGILHENKQYDEALKSYLEAKKIFQDNGIKNDLAACYNNIATLYLDKEEFDTALENYKIALELADEVGDADLLITIYKNMGVIYMHLKEYKKAEEMFRINLDHVVYMQNTAPPEKLRGLKLAYIDSYQALMVLYTWMGDVNRALAIFEYYTSGSLTDQIQKDADLIEAVAEREEKVLEQGKPMLRPDGNTLLIFAGFNLDEGIIFQWTKGDLFITNVRKYMIAEQIEDKIGQNMDSVFSRNPSLARLLVQETSISSADRRFDQYILYFHYLLSRPFLPRQQNDDLEFLSHKFYELFIETQLESMDDTDSLTIIREGVLAFLPFETLKDSSGKYLVEKYNIRYEISLAVEAYLKERNMKSASDNLLAFGGAEYQKKASGDERGITLEQIEAFRNSYQGLKSSGDLNADTRGGLTRDIYRTFNYDQWDYLPGTLTEVQAIKKIFPKSNVFTGNTVSEETIFRLQEKNMLKNFSTIHFATHGIVIPEIPELSALVLSTEKEGSKYDGYLTADEIAGLNLAAEFVNLSACETGLGKVYPGEGMVGLIHAFLVAGANSVCASLWSVSDESTSEFMIGLYSKAAKEGMSYSEAINEMKREFIASGEYSLPYYWAPFQYYGN